MGLTTSVTRCWRRVEIPSVDCRWRASERWARRSRDGRSMPFESPPAFATLPPTCRSCSPSSPWPTRSHTASSANGPSPMLALETIVETPKRGGDVLPCVGSARAGRRSGRGCVISPRPMVGSSVPKRWWPTTRSARTCATASAGRKRWSRSPTMRSTMRWRAAESVDDRVLGTRLLRSGAARARNEPAEAWDVLAVGRAEMPASRSAVGIAAGPLERRFGGRPHAGH